MTTKNYNIRNKYVLFVFICICITIGIIIGYLIHGCLKSLNNENPLSINHLSFDEAFEELDYTNRLFSNVERGDIMNAKSDMVAARNLCLINRIIVNSNNCERGNWFSEKSAWENLSNEIVQFISAKMEEQWETGKTGTAGASYVNACRYKMMIVRALLLDSITNKQGFLISEDRTWLDYTCVSSQIPSDISIGDLKNEIVRYLNHYISDGSFVTWRDQDSLNLWRQTTTGTITALENYLDDYIKEASEAFITLPCENTDVILIWVLQQISQIIKIGDY